MESEHRLVSVLLQIGVIVLTARLFAVVFRKLRQPTVVGEVLAGLALGPSLLGKLEAWHWLPKVSPYIFNPVVAPAMQSLAQVGVVLLVFVIGLEFDFSHVRARSARAVTVAVVGVIVPFVLGSGLGYLLYGRLAAGINRLGFILFMGTAMSITALPVLGRMLMEMKVNRTRLAATTIAAAAMEDAIGWILLATVSSLATADFNPWISAIMLGETLVFAGVMLFAVRPVMRAWIRWSMARHDGELGFNAFAILLAILFACAIATSLIGIFALFGAFMLGAILSDQHAFRAAMDRLLSLFVTVFFLPIFFTYTGLRTDIGSLDSGMLWLAALAVVGVAVVGKLGGCTFAALACRTPVRESVCIGILMNTRGLMELVVINVGYDLGVIPKSVFCMLVMMAVVTTMMTTPLLVSVMRGTELEEGMVAAGFATEGGGTKARRGTM